MPAHPMTRLRQLVLLLLTLTIPRLVLAQGNAVALTNTGAPAGGCAFVMIYIDKANGKLYDCNNGVWNLVGPGAAGSATWASLTAGTNANAGSFISSGNTWDFTLATLFKARLAAGLTTSTNGDFGQDSITGYWHFWQNAGDRLFIGSTNVGAAGQAFLSNGNGTGAFADPIVSGPDAVGAAPTKNPVQMGGIFLTTPATLTNNQVGALQLDNLQNALVHINFALPSGSNVIGHVINDTGSTTAITGNVAVTVADAADVTLGAKADAKSTATDTTAITAMSVLKEISFMEQTPASRAVTNAGTFAVQDTWQAGTALAGEVAPVATATTTDTTLRCILVSAASTNATNCKNAAGNVYGFRFVNTTTTVYYLRMYNASSSPTCSSATNFVESIPIPPAAAAGGAGGIVSMEAFGEGYTTGISFCFTGGSSSTDNTNAAVGVFGTILYK